MNAIDVTVELIWKQPLLRKGLPATNYKMESFFKLKKQFTIWKGKLLISTLISPCCTSSLV